VGFGVVLLARRYNPSIVSATDSLPIVGSTFGQAEGLLSNPVGASGVSLALVTPFIPIAMSQVGKIKDALFKKGQETWEGEKNQILAEKEEIVTGLTSKLNEVQSKLDASDIIDKTNSDSISKLTTNFTDLQTKYQEQATELLRLKDVETQLAETQKQLAELKSPNLH